MSSPDECEYYYYDSGYSCALKRKNDGNSSVDSDTVHRYCWGYHYRDCPRYKAAKNDTGCFLTSACTEARGLPDDCHELTVLRNYRDSYLKSLPEGEAEISEYYKIAPQIVTTIKQRSDALQIFDDIYNDLVAPCVAMIEKGENDEAHVLYRSEVKKLETRFSI